MIPAPGTAKEEDVLIVGKPACELVDSTIVEKSMGYFEGRLGTILLVIIEQYLSRNDVGFTNGEGAYTRIGGQVRIPDVSFVRWDRVGEKRVPAQPISDIVPNLAVEILSEGNTVEELNRKRHEYFEAGVEQVWIVDPRRIEVAVWKSGKECVVHGIDDTIEGGNLLPGFQLSVRQWFERASGNR